jgi:Zn-finger nucleic acid-binding protein
MSEEKNEPTVWYKCPWCICVFLNRFDLEKHMLAFSINQTINRNRVNEQDHKELWAEAIKKRDHEYFGEEGF